MDAAGAVKLNPDNSLYSVQTRFYESSKEEESSKKVDLIDVNNAIMTFAYMKIKIPQSTKFKTLTLFEGNLQIINKTNREMISELLTKYTDSVKYENLDNAHSCFCQSYQGVSSQYRDYYTVKTKLRDAFSNEETMNCDFQNISISVSGDAATVEADYSRTLKLSGNPSSLNDKNTVKILLRKENGSWFFWQDTTEKIIGYNGALPPGPPIRKR